MAIWLVLALMTGAAVMAVLWPLSRVVDAGEAGRDSDQRFYRDQIADIEADVGRGLLSPVEADAARAEAGRRLLRARAASTLEPEAPFGEPALRRRRAASALALSTVPLLAVALYGVFGSPALPGNPLAARLEADPRRVEFAEAVARVERHLADHPDDGRGWEVLAPVYLKAGRAEDAAKAYQEAIRHLGENASRLAGYGEALVIAKDGVVSAEARAAFERGLALDGTAVKPKYYLAEAAEQDGDRDGARARYADLVATAPAGAPYLPVIRERLDRLGGNAPAAVATAPTGDADEAIRGMVAGLAARLEERGGTPQEWARLVRSYVVLGEPDKANAALDKARKALAASPAEARAPLDAIAREVSAAPPGDGR
jgi:cytochrome c-type biogenesis protein CcmH